MSYGEEYPRQLAARFRNAARDLLDHVAHADREQKRQLIQHAFKLVQTAEALGMSNAPRHPTAAAGG
jgi:hypothetical protein